MSTASPLMPTVADRDAEIAALQTAFDEYIASSRELEDELDGELAKMQEKLAESSAANAALISQLESLNPQLSSLERALTDSKNKLEAESELRRQTELAQDEAENRAREAEGALEALKSESDNIHEQLAFREEEVEEMRLELEVENERHKVEEAELQAQLAEATKKLEKGAADGVYNGGDAPTTSKNKKEVDNVSTMSEDDFVSMTVDTTEGVANEDDHDDYIKRLEDELEDVTEQLIEAETNISAMEQKLGSAEKSKVGLETKVTEMEQRIGELDLLVSNNEKAGPEAEKENALAKEELALVTEELTLTQEELKAAEEDTNAAKARLEEARNKHKDELEQLKSELEQAKGNARSAQLEVESLQKSLNEINSETDSLRSEVTNLNKALHNAKLDHEKTLEDMDELRRAFDGVESENQISMALREKELMSGHMRQVKDLEAELDELRAANKAMETGRKSKESASNNTSNLVLLDIQVKLERTEKELSRAKNDLEECRAELRSSKRKVEELSAGSKNTLFVSTMTDAPISKTMLLSPKKLEKLSAYLFDEDKENSPQSEYRRSHARSRFRSAQMPSSRARSNSPSTVERLEHDLIDKAKKVSDLKNECEELKKQRRMSEVRAKHLEEDVTNLQDKVQNSPQMTESMKQLAALGSMQSPQKPRDETEDWDKDVEKILESGDNKLITTEFRALVKKSTSQKEHNSQLLLKILKLQGNIQVCCRIRPLTTSETKKGYKRTVESLNETEVGCYDSRTKAWKSFAFDKVWGPDMHQLGIFQDVEPLALSVVDGYNACIFAYGQTGSGKTYTMEGSSSGSNVGISYRTIEKVFNLLNYRTAQRALAVQKYEQSNMNGISTKNSDDMDLPILPTETSLFNFSINVGMLEIYNDGVYDLLLKTDKRNAKQKKTTLDIKRDKDGKIEVPGLTKEPVNSIADVMKLLKRGNVNRATASTDLNAHSSRSHMVLIVEVKSGLDGEEPVTGNLFLVDLAGSERVRKSAVEGKELKEASHINKSLAALGNVMEALDRKASHVPYRDSKLTYLLQDSLGGNSRTMMVVTVCPTSSTFDETQHALQFATRVRRINLGSAKRNVTSKNLEATLKVLSSELKVLAKAKERSEDQLQSLKRDHTRIQDRLKLSSENRAKAQDEARTLTVLKQSNAAMTARWQKEKQAHEKTVSEYEKTQNEYKRLQQQVGKIQRENDRLSKIIADKEIAQETMKTELRKAKDGTSAANLRARKAQMLQSRPSKISSPRAVANGTTSPTAAQNVDPAEARASVLAILEKHDPKKVGKIDAIMDRFQGRESYLLLKMSARYQSDDSSEKSDKSKVTSQRRSEIALARHMERMRTKKSERSISSGNT